jgi:tRNA-Thr(GGU) m(6)t(6)A37 methyltransferase TsaA
VEIKYGPIGVVHSPFTEPVGMPIQPCFADGVEGEVELFEEFERGLTDLDGFSHIHLIYHLHRSSGFSLEVVPHMDTERRGLFSTRAPRRPNPIGLSVVRLLGITGARLRVADLDILDGTPVLDIKPFNPTVDNREHCRVGCMERAMDGRRIGIADTRFVGDDGSETGHQDT